MFLFSFLKEIGVKVSHFHQLPNKVEQQFTWHISYSPDFGYMSCIVRTFNFFFCKTVAHGKPEVLLHPEINAVVVEAERPQTLICDVYGLLSFSIFTLSITFFEVNVKI